VEEIKAHLILDRKSFSVLRRDMPGDGTDLLPRTKFNYSAEVGNGLSSALIIAVVLWIVRAFSEAPLAIRDPKREMKHDHPLLDLWRRPNPWYGERILRGALAADYTLHGNAYLWISERDGAKRPAQLVYLPCSSIAPRGTETELITHYDRSGTRDSIPLADMIHFRQGLDPLDMKLGLSKLRALFREVFTDDEAANFTASVMRNMGFAGVVVQPEAEGDTFAPKTRERFKRYFRRMFRGDLRGEVLVTSARVKIGSQEIDLSKLDLGALRDIPEERVTAVTGVPAAVVGFGSGLQQTKVGATLEELRKLAYNNAIIPMQADMTEELTRRLLPEFETKDGYAVAFDNSEVQSLQEDATKKADRYTRLYQAGVITRAVALRAIGEEATPADEVYRTSIADVFVRAGEEPIQIQTTTEENGSEEETPEEVAAPAPKLRYPPTKSAAGLRRQRLDRRFIADFETISRRWAGELRKYFEGIGEEIAQAWLAERKGFGGNGHMKAEPDETLDLEAERRLIDMLILAHPPTALDFGSQYLRIAKRTVAGIESVMRLGVMLDEPMEREILELGGTRRGLIDMTQETRDAMFKALADARADGLGVDATARRLRDGIAAGPWPDVQTRASVIARTETKHAQNASSMEAYQRAEHVTGIQVFDAQLGDTDAPCMAINGKVVSKQEAGSIEMLEHPNCTRSFAPVVG
jgi:HK97 family phage portal protein